MCTQNYLEKSITVFSTTWTSHSSVKPSMFQFSWLRFPFFSFSYSYPLSFLGDIIKRENPAVMNSSHHDRIIISDNVAILWSSFWFVLIVLSHYIASYYTHSFLSPWRCLNVYCMHSDVASIMTNILWKISKNCRIEESYRLFHP